MLDTEVNERWGCQAFPTWVVRFCPCKFLVRGFRGVMIVQATMRPGIERHFWDFSLNFGFGGTLALHMNSPWKPCNAFGIEDPVKQVLRVLRV